VERSGNVSNVNIIRVSPIEILSGFPWVHRTPCRRAICENDGWRAKGDVVDISARAEISVPRHAAFLVQSEMSARGSGSTSTALRRLMTEYKQLTAGGAPHLYATSTVPSHTTRFPRWHVHSRQASEFHIPAPSHARTAPGPISESDFFTWEALICGPKDTPFVRPFSIPIDTHRVYDCIL
jgi:ubiquitin-protein ligase